MFSHDSSLRILRLAVHKHLKDDSIYLTCYRRFFSWVVLVYENKLCVYILLLHKHSMSWRSLRLVMQETELKLEAFKESVDSLESFPEQENSA